MRVKTTWMRWLSLLSLAAIIGGCGDDDSPGSPGTGNQPTYATVSFTLDDTTDHLYTEADGLAWKGTFNYDSATGILTFDAASAGPFVMLADDGPVADGGHEPAGATAGDHLWGAVVQVETPASDLTFVYGVISGSTDGSDGPWIAGNQLQSVTVPAGETGAVTAHGLTVIQEDPGNYATVTFAIDDSANQTYTETDGLAWKGSFSYEAGTRVLTQDGSWGGPFVLLYDDGPINGGGHEPEGATASDHIWSVAVLVDNSVQTMLEYGAIRGSVNGSDGQWIWIGSNGTVTIPAAAEGPITAPGLVLPAFGTIDLKLTIDLSANGANLNPDFQGVDYSGSVTVKGSAWGWQEVTLVDDGTAGDLTEGDGIFTFLLSEGVGPHTGLLESGQTAQFVFVLNGVEYRSGGAAATEGLSGYLDARGGFEPVPIRVQATGDQNTYVTAP